jgi:hypothetical protein
MAGRPYQRELRQRLHLHGIAGVLVRGRAADVLDAPAGDVVAAALAVVGRR